MNSVKRDGTEISSPLRRHRPIQIDFSRYLEEAIRDRSIEDEAMNDRTTDRDEATRPG